MNEDQEDGQFSEQELLRMAKNYDIGVSKHTLVCCPSIGIIRWQKIAQTPELDIVRRVMYPDPDHIIWPKPPGQGKKSALLATLCLPGLGQIYLGQVAKGLSIMVLVLLITTATWGIGGIPPWIIAGIDAQRLQKKLLGGQPVGRWECF